MNIPDNFAAARFCRACAKNGTRRRAAWTCDFVTDERPPRGDADAKAVYCNEPMCATHRHGVNGAGDRCRRHWSGKKGLA